jgi:hypothetical protein
MVVAQAHTAERETHAARCRHHWQSSTDCTYHSLTAQGAKAAQQHLRAGSTALHPLLAKVHLAHSTSLPRHFYDPAGRVDRPS